ELRRMEKINSNRKDKFPQSRDGRKDRLHLHHPSFCQLESGLGFSEVKSQLDVKTVRVFVAN
ncbi:hypothetical protein HAX54_018629, partial [Datura stramonium]|nr:hypothetical protein [Datura stramonium]